MVERPLDPHRPPSGTGRHDTWTDFRWLFRFFAVSVGLLAAFRAIAGSAAPEPTEAAEPSGPQPEEVQYPDGRIEHPSVRYEKRDVRFRYILIALLVIACIASFHYWIVWWFFNACNHYESAIKRSPYPLATMPSMQLPAEPRLEQINRLENIEKANVYLRQQARERILQSAGPTSESGYVHIPIDEAMRRVVSELPVRKEMPHGPTKDDGLLDGGEPNSGRMFRGATR